MSIENELKRIADALERITMPTASQTFSIGPEMVPAATVTSTQPTPADVKKRPAKAAKTEAQPAAPAEPEVTKENLSDALKAYLVKFPGQEGADKARKVFTDAGAVNITSLAPEKYKEVFLKIQQMMKG
jgi:cell division septation protein DedD